MPKPRVLIPEPTSDDRKYNQRGWPQYAAAIAQAANRLRSPFTPPRKSRLSSSQARKASCCRAVTPI